MEDRIEECLNKVVAKIVLGCAVQERILKDVKTKNIAKRDHLFSVCGGYSNLYVGLSAVPWRYS